MTSLRPRCCTFWANRSPPPPSTTAVSPATVCGCRSYAVSYKILSRDAKAMRKVKALRIAETKKWPAARAAISCTAQQSGELLCCIYIERSAARLVMMLDPVPFSSHRQVIIKKLRENWEVSSSRTTHPPFPPHTGCCRGSAGGLPI